MSFFDDASLAFLPSGAAGKDGKAYSIKPTDGTGDFTFSRGSNLAATRVGADGLIEKGRENLLLNSIWNGVGSNVAPTSFGITSFASGTFDAGSQANSIRFTAPTSADRIMITQGPSVTGIVTSSVYVEEIHSGTISLADVISRSGGSSSVIAFMEDGIVVNATDLVSAGKTYSLTLSVASAVQWRFGVGTSGPTTGDITLSKPQVEIGLAATDVIESGATTGKAGLLEDEPRFDYSGGATCPSLLLEGSRTNLWPYSEYSDDFEQLTNVTINTNSEVSPEGLQNATTIVADAVSGKHEFCPNFLSYTSGLDYTASCFVKANGYNFAIIKFAGTGGVFGDEDVFFNLSTGQVATNSDNLDATIEAVGTDGWYRISATNQAVGTALGKVFYAIGDSDNSGIFTGDGTSGLDFYGLQLESGSYPTSYIPNHSGGSVTRGEDDLNLSNLQSNNLFGTDSGFIFYEFKDFDDLFIGWSSSNSKDRFQYFDIDGSANGYFRFRGYESSISLQVVNLGASPNFLVIPDGSKKICISWNASKFSLFADGSKVGEIPITTSIAVNGISNFNGDLGNKPAFIEELLWGNSTMSDADAITLTTL